MKVWAPIFIVGGVVDLWASGSRGIGSHGKLVKVFQTSNAVKVWVTGVGGCAARFCGRGAFVWGRCACMGVVRAAGA